MSPETHFQTVSLTKLAAKGLVARTDVPRPVVLVVDDERVIADTLAAILGQCGFSVFTAYEGRSALEMALTIPPNLLLTDVAMPGLNGVDLAIAVRQAIPDCQVLLFSGHAATAGLLARAHEEGHDFTLLQKPLHPKDLLARVSETLESQTANSASAFVV